MINELIRIADLNGRSGWEAVRRRPIHWFIDLDDEGRVLTVSPTTKVVERTRNDERKNVRGKEFEASANYYMQWAEVKSKKRHEIQSVGTNQHNWLPDFLTGPVDEIFDDGVDGDNKSRNKQEQFRQLLVNAYSENPTNKSIRAICLFLKSCPKFLNLPLPPEARQNLDWFRKRQNQEGETLSFRVSGRIAVEDSDLRDWWAEQVQKMRALVSKHLDPGRDAYEPGEGSITKYFPNVFSSVPFASFGSATFTSYGLGSQTATMRIETAEKLAAGLNWLLLRKDSSLRLADETAVFWTVAKNQETGKPRASAVPFVRLLEKADPLAVRDFLRGIWGSRPVQIDPGQFYAATFCPAGKGRFSVRSWHTDTLPHAQQNLKNWFNALGTDSINETTPTLNQLAEATIPKAKGQKTKPAPATYSALFESALFGGRLPYQLFASAIARQRAELAKGVDKKDESTFEQRLQARTALIQVFFALKHSNGEIHMNHETVLDPKCDHPAILCGRLLALLDKIHNEAHTTRNVEGKTVSKGTASSPAGRFYAAAAATPALAFPQLLKLARYHLNKIGGGWAYRLEFGWRDDEDNEQFDSLAAVVDRLNKTAAGNFPRLLSLEDQGRFALGFYHERCRKWPKKLEAENQPETSTPIA